jgi:hypothetical protein
MKRKNQKDVVGLGAASAVTKGGAIGFVDSDRTLQPHPGLSRD